MHQHTQHDLVSDYVELIKQALSCVGPEYFKLRTTYKPIVRERVFCYELYHQIRLHEKHHHTLSLHGEIDKSGHVDFRREDRRNPDFVFHAPGEHGRNTLVIEVKGTLRHGADDLAGDLETILVFINRYEYKAGIFILYNHSFRELEATMGGRLQEMASCGAADAVYILCISGSGEPCEQRMLSELRRQQCVQRTGSASPHEAR